MSYLASNNIKRHEFNIEKLIHLKNLRRKKKKNSETNINILPILKKFFLNISIIFSKQKLTIFHKILYCHISLAIFVTGHLQSLKFSFRILLIKMMSLKDQERI